MGAEKSDGEQFAFTLYLALSSILIQQKLKPRRAEVQDQTNLLYWNIPGPNTTYIDELHMPW